MTFLGKLCYLVSSSASKDVLKTSEVREGGQASQMEGTMNDHLVMDKCVPGCYMVWPKVDKTRER